jgi:pyruvate formate lyase activating enzyme
VEGCYAGAMEMIGEERAAEEVVEVVLRDKPFYDNSGGGMTVSGGEPLAQASFTEALLRLCRQAGVSTAVDTACVGSWSIIERLCPLVDLWLCDVKHTDPDRHRDLTGSGNRDILNNIRRLCGAGADVLLRLPLVPGVNDDEENLRAVGGLAREIGPTHGAELMPYHRIGQGKYERLGKDYGLADVPDAAEDCLDRALSIIREAGVDRVICGRTPRL